MSAPKVDIDVAAEAISPSKNVEAVKESSPVKRKAEEVVEEVDSKKARVEEPAEASEEVAAEKESAEETKTEAEAETTEEKPSEEVKETEEQTVVPTEKDREQAKKVLIAAFSKKEVEGADEKAKAVEEKIFTLKGTNQADFLGFAYSVAFNIVSADDFVATLEDAEKEISIDGIAEDTKTKINEKVESYIKSDDTEIDFDALTVSSQ